MIFCHAEGVTLSMVYESRSSGCDRDKISERVLPDSLAGRFLTKVSWSVDNEVFMLNLVLFKETGSLVVFVVTVVINRERSNMYIMVVVEDTDVETGEVLLV